jgi:hypothetical protein
MLPRENCYWLLSTTRDDRNATAYSAVTIMQQLIRSSDTYHSKKSGFADIARARKI